MKRINLLLMLFAGLWLTSCNKQMEDAAKVEDPISGFQYELENPRGIERTKSFFEPKGPPPSFTPCDQLDIHTSLINSDGDCCNFAVDIYHKNYDDSTPEINVEYYIDGEFRGGAAMIVGMSFPVEVCEDPVLVEIYSDGILCFSEYLTCEPEECCANLSYSLSGYQDGDCCVYTFTVDDPTGCWEASMAFQFNSDIGPPDTFIWHDNGVTVHICDPEQRIRFIVWDNLNFDNMCYSSSWFTSNGCKS